MRLLEFKRESRQTLWLTLGLWAITYPIFLLPSLAGPDALPVWRAALLGGCVALGLALSPALLLLVRRSEGLRPGRRVVLIGAGVLAVAAVVSLADAWFFQLAYARWKPEQPPVEL